MELTEDIPSLIDFKRDTSRFLRRLKATGHPVILTINGKAELVVQDASSYQRLFDLAQPLATIKFVRDGFAAIDRGEGRRMAEDAEDETRARSDE